MEKYREIGKDYFKVVNKYSDILGIFRRNIKEEDFKRVRNDAIKALECIYNKESDEVTKNYCTLLLIEMEKFIRKFNKRLEGIISEPMILYT